MANQATFHAKISADARQFVQEVESANDAIKSLVSSYDKISQSSGSASGKADKTRKKSTESEIKGMQDAAIAAGNKVTQAALDNQKKVDQARRKTGKEENLSPEAANAREALALISRREKTARQIVAAKALENTEAKESVLNSKAQANAEERRLRLLKETSGYGRIVSDKDLGEKNTRLLTGRRIEPTVAQGPTRQGVKGLADLQRLQKVYNDDKKKQLSYDRQITQMNRQQMDAMVTGRYALYDMANAYRGIAMGAMRVTRALSQTVVQAAQFESSFTAVERAAKLEVGTQAFMNIRQALIDLSTEIPVAFDQITEIATLGAQMGIAAQDLTKFTETVAAFSAVTGASIDETAEKFGRISSLARVPTEEFENLASSVLYAGFNAVATEEEILKMAESIAAAGANAGYSGKQIVGLSTALASLGVQPEQARGVILRLFNDITRAAEGSTDKMGEFASMAGYTATEFQSIWKESPEEFFTSFLTGLSNVESLTTELDKLGITNTREINVLQRLSGNMDVYSQSIREASQAYEEGTALADIYGKTADNLEAKFQRLINAFDALKASSSEAFGEALKPIVEGLVAITNAASDFAKGPVGKMFIPIIMGATAAVAIFAGMRFATSILTAQMLAMRVAILKTGQVTGLTSNLFKGLRNAITGNLYAVTLMNGQMAFLDRTQMKVAVSTNTLSAETMELALRENKATVATRALSGAMSGLGIIMGAAMVASIVGIVVEMVKMNKQIGENVGGVEALAAALTEDTKAFEAGEGYIAKHTVRLGENQDAAKDNADASRFIIDAQGNIARSFDDTAEAANEATIAIGENFKQLLLQDISESDELTNFVEQIEKAGSDTTQVFDALGVNLADFVDAAAEDPEFGAFNLLNEALANAESRMSTFTPATQKLIQDFITLNGGIAGTNLQINSLESFALGAVGQVNDLSGGVTGFGSSAAYAGRDLGTFLSLIQQATSESIEYKRVLGALGVVAPAAADGLGEIAEESEGVEESASGASKALRTVLDYASDLQGIFDRVVGIEFGETTAQDKIASGWEKIADEAADAQKAVKDANAEILELTADKSVLEYQLSVAERYGDEKRAAVIRAKLEKINGKLADEEKNLSDAQEDAKRSLVDNTAAGRENREVILGMVDSYQDLIEAAIETGMEGEELEKFIASLKEEFIEQGESVGYSRGELVQYSDLFDQFIDVVDNVDPRVDIKFDSNISAAEQAFNEYMAKLKAANGYKTTQTAQTDIKISQPAPLRLMVNGSDVRLYRMALERGALSAKEYYKILYGLSPNNLPDTGVFKGRGFTFYSTGGQVSGPGTGTSDSIPAMLSNGEFVMSAAAVRNYGTDFMNTLNQQKAGGAMPMPSSGAGASGGTTIAYLSPEDRALLRAVADRPVNLYADNTKIAQSVNSGNVTLSQRGLK